MGEFWCPASLPPWTGRLPWASPRGRTGCWSLMRRRAASTVPLAQPVAHQGDRYHQERQGKQERLIRYEVAEPLEKCHDSLHEAGQAAGEPRPRDMQRLYAAVRKDCTKAGGLRIKILYMRFRPGRRLPPANDRRRRIGFPRRCRRRSSSEVEQQFAERMPRAASGSRCHSVGRSRTAAASLKRALV